MLNYRGSKVRALPAHNDEAEDVYAVGRWNGGSSKYISLHSISWPGGSIPDASTRVIQLLGVVPISNATSFGKVS